MESKLIDHLFRHHSGKMVSVLTRIFGLAHLETIEDAVQDTFIKASVSWRNKRPDNPEAWLTQAAKNRVLDLFRKLKTQQKHYNQISYGAESIAIDELFLDTEIEDAQLRMIFTACHPNLDPRERIAFALKTISGFNIREIAAALLTKEQTVRRRLNRARQAIQKSGISFDMPRGKALPLRLESVMEVLYLIFNEGFHSITQDILVRKDLCGEAMRLTKLLLKNEHTRCPAGYALFALMCFHSARLETKTNADNELLDLRTQDRSQWHFPLVELGNTMMTKAVEGEAFLSYHYEAAIAAEHLKAGTFEDTDWNRILYYYECLYALQPMPTHQLTMAVVCMQIGHYDQARSYLDTLDPDDFEQRAYLYYGTLADYYQAVENHQQALQYIDLAIDKVINKLEQEYLVRKKLQWSSDI